jgi:ABC-type lipoprotein export system ATPase subunit
MIMSEMTTSCLSTLFELQGVDQYYRLGKSSVRVLDNIDFILYRGDTCAITGTSGSGKSTLLNILGLLERPAGGRVSFAGQDVMAACTDTLAQWRNRQLGFVFQSFNLLARLSALDNVALPLMYAHQARSFARERAACQLQAVGLANKALHRPADLSGGQRQRVAIARALVTRPSLILADEPTGNLDQQCADDIIDLLLDLNLQHQVTLVTVTHDTRLAARFARRIEVADGQLHEYHGHVRG